MNARKLMLFHQTHAATGSLAAAARAAEITSTQARRLRQTLPPEGADPVRAALAALESEAVRRALEGVTVPVFHQGKECGTTVKHSDTLLMFLLKTLNPARYGSPQAAGAGVPAREPVQLDLDLSAAEDGEGQ